MYVGPHHGKTKLAQQIADLESILGALISIYVMKLIHKISPGGISEGREAKRDSNSFQIG